MRIIFMGTPDFSVPALEAIKEAGHEILAVVTQPDKPKGRGKEVQMTPVKEKALEYQLPVYQPVKARDPEFVKILSDLEPDLILVIAFGQLLPKSILDIPKYGCVNIHASLLPKYRGASPLQYAVINGEKESGVTTMMMAEVLDTGDMLDQEAIFLDEKETFGSLHDKLSRLGGRLILKTIDKLEDGTAIRIPQDDSKACYVGMIKKSMGDIDWSMDAVSIERLIRGLNPWPSAYTVWNGKVMKLWEAEVVDKEYEGGYGQVAEVSRDCLVIKTGKGGLSIRKLQLQGKKCMDIDAFLRGYPIAKGTVLERLADIPKSTENVGKKEERGV
ncbi:methionyl-tRNA formyltransferase [Lacrimispora sphenoides]|uniref:Methionyl-tRNA formyltransferase n=1 Tax=Lacrimispora sphenoides JCM 1415 TaxID=1297793 RepID=A0ABY1C707_9FIRM|nr:methionyl-tRNA formyltransferase [Lacrimispora sphenoides]SET75867.1 methionyl-tRNA formyltransferase [[Clostridium] sphenoides JCM 1415]SUY51042.1 methionyl-tRNA formyltransferase [Lacrimispora sphenoides]